MQRTIDNKVLLDHMGKHAIHLVFMVTMLVAFRVADVPVSMITFMVLVLGSIAMLEAGLWVIHRRDRTVEAT
ncbi:MAG TPA: hypothetical protein VFN21_13445 [Acidimicrobiales bacterium]|nr:hypothetical protein [Acidimicrobiales bacterium]